MEIDGQALQWQTLQILQWIAPSNSVKGLEQIPSSTIYTPVPTKLISLCAAKGKHLHFLFIFHHLLLVNPWMTANMPFYRCFLLPIHLMHACTLHIGGQESAKSGVLCRLKQKLSSLMMPGIGKAVGGLMQLRCRWVSSVCPTRGKC